MGREKVAPNSPALGEKADKILVWPDVLGPGVITKKERSTCL
jgi:hypothetical protein